MSDDIILIQSDSKFLYKFYMSGKIEKEPLWEYTDEDLEGAEITTDE